MSETDRRKNWGHHHHNNVVATRETKQRGSEAEDEGASINVPKRMLTARKTHQQKMANADAKK